MTATVSVSTEITAIAVAEPPAQAGGATSSAPDRASPGPSAGARLPHLAGRRVGSDLGALAKTHPTTSPSSPTAACWSATGNKGKIYRLAGDPFSRRSLTRANAQQVTALLRDSDGKVTFATSNPGKILRLSPARADRGTYTSDVRDAQTVATWGAISGRQRHRGHPHRDLDALGQHAHAG